MALFVMADLHLSLSVEKPMDVFGSRWQGYVEKIKNAWLDTVSCSDTVIIPGDISWAMTIEEAREDLLFLDSLPGTKIIGKGNHDYWWGTASKIKAFFEKNGIATIKILYNNAYLCENKLICGSRGWFSDQKRSPDDADYEKLLRREAQRLKISFDAADALAGENEKGAYEKICFLHFPPIYQGELAAPILEAIEGAGIKRCFYGHIHSRYDIAESIMHGETSYELISSDYLNFVPKPIT